MRRRLLIADACFTQAERVGQYFSRRGYEFDVVNDGLECIEKLAHSPPEVLILDWDLPWGGGAGVIARLRDVQQFSRAPVILIGDELTDDMDVREPVVRCLLRPFGIESLHDAVDEALISRASGRGAIRPVSVETLATSSSGFDEFGDQDPTENGHAHHDRKEFATSALYDSQRRIRAEVTRVPSPR
jgi:DNA-binding response OmpR family regulator